MRGGDSVYVNYCTGGDQGCQERETATTCRVETVIVSLKREKKKSYSRWKEIKGGGNQNVGDTLRQAEHRREVEESTQEQ